MTTNVNGADASILSPDAAFSVLGNETRMAILQTIGEADEPLSFSEIRARIGSPDPGQFNYHLNQLTGHFIRKTDDGYDLLQAGRRVIEAVLSGAVTEVPDLARTHNDLSCNYCGAPTEVAYDATTPRPVKIYCTDCAGAADWVESFDNGQVATLRFSPAGLHGRTPQEISLAAATREHLEILAVYSDLCPRCSATIEHSLSVCESHDPVDDVCADCNRRYAAQIFDRCTNCHFELEAGFAARVVLGTVEMQAFLTAHGRNLLTETWSPVIKNADEEILSTEPFEARFTFTDDDDSIILTVDDDLNVVDVTRPESS